MANKKISELTEATSVAGTDIIPVVEGGATKKLTVNNLFTERSFYSSKKVATIGEVEMLTADGTFDTDSGWTLGAGWAVASGKATHTPGNTATLVGTTNMTNAYVYKSVLTISGRTAGSINVSLGTFDIGLTLTADGAYTFYGICSPTTTYIITPTTDFDGSIETVQLFEFSRSEPEFTMDAGSGRPHDFRTGNDGGNLGIGNQAVSVVQLDYDYAGAKDTSGPAGPYRGNNNMGIGNRSLASVVSGKYNVAIGQESMLRLTTGYDNVAIGDSAMNNATSAYRCVAIGYEAMGRITNGYNNLSIGSFSGYALTTAHDNVLLGDLAAYDLTTGNYNICLGSSSLTNLTTGSQNIAIGWNALFAATTSSNNVVIGSQAGAGLTTGANNVLIGASAGRQTAANVPVTDGTAVLIGYNTGRTVASATALNNYIGIGYAVEVSASNQTVIGNASMAEVYLGSISGAAKLICSKPKFTAIPTSADGLAAGDVWSNGGVLTIV